MSRRMYRTRVSDEALPDFLELKLGDETFIFVKKTWDVKEGEESIGLRYGTNPHQPAAFYIPEDPEQCYFGDIELKKMGKGGLSATNLEDGYRALRIVSYFDEATVGAVAVMKHLNPTGVGVAHEPEDTATIFEKAWSGDPRAAYGSVVASNFDVDGVMAEKIIERTEDDRQKYYIECLFAPYITPEALEILQDKKSLRVVSAPKVGEFLERGLPYDIKVFSDGILLEKPFYTKFRRVEDIESLDSDGNKKTGVVTERVPSAAERQQSLYAWWVCGEKRSNGTVIWKDEKVLAVGTGQQDRIGAIEIALARAKRVGHDLEGSVLASDGFMLWDNVDPLAEVGVSTIIQPGSSAYDKRVIKRCNEYDISMIFTGERVFRHF